MIYEHDLFLLKKRYLNEVEFNILNFTLIQYTQVPIGSVEVVSTKFVRLFVTGCSAENIIAPAGG